MKLVNFLIFFILTLSLSVNISCKGYELADNINLLKNLKYDENVESLNCSSESCIDLSDNDYVEVFSDNNSSIYLTENDIYIMSQVVYAESKGEPFEGKVAVASVILNRVLSPQFPDTVQEVIFQPYAFSCVVDGKITVEPSSECYDAVYDAIKGYDPTGDALFFYNPETATCSWMKSVEKSDTTLIGQHLFFSLAY